MDDWDAIKRLAADFQRAQDSDTLQKLSERNVIDLIKKLVELELIELIYTTDGKEFVTPEHLKKEIGDEVYCNGGRMHIHDLAARLKIDYQHIESKAKQLVKEYPDEYSLVLGQIIHSNYKVTLGKQMNDCMLLNGQLSIAEFSKSLDLPSEFLLSIIKEVLNNVDEEYVVSQDGRTYYTSDFMDRYKSIIAGTLTAITHSISISSLMKRLDIPEKIFTPILEGLMKEGRIDATIENRTIIPAVCIREQNEWISKFYLSNSYIEYDVLQRMDIKQPKTFLRKKFPDGTQLDTCYVSPLLIEQIESQIEEAISTNWWIDISTILPPAIQPQDIEQILKSLIKSNKHLNDSCMLACQTYICSLGYLTSYKKTFCDMMQSRALGEIQNLINYFMGGSSLKEQQDQQQQSQQKQHQEQQPPQKEQEDQSKQSVQDEKDQLKHIQNQRDEQNTSKRNNTAKKGNKQDDEDEEDQEQQQQQQQSQKDKKSKQDRGGQGREIKQKSVKKKYMAGVKQAQEENEAPSSKGPRSNRGRAARRGASPDNSVSTLKNKSIQKERLVFMTSDEIIKKISSDLVSEDCSDEFLSTLADLIKNDLDPKYEAVAKETLQVYLKSQENDTNPEEENVELVE